MKNGWILTLVAALTLTISQVAFAHPIPEMCQANPTATMHYKVGERFGKMVVDQAWASAGSNCEGVDNFLEILSNSLNSLIVGPNASLSSQCRTAGIINGGLAALDALCDSCGEFCMSGNGG